MKRRLYLVRHAAAQGEGMYGRSDVPLSDEGRRQALRLASQAAEWRTDAVVSSDLLRARDTAAAILNEMRSRGRSIQDEVDAFSGLRERNFGEWDGLTWGEIEARHPDLARSYVNNWDQVVPPGGESIESLERRVADAWQEIWEREWRVLALVAHGGTNRLLLRRFFRLPLDALTAIELPPASYLRVDFLAGTPLSAHDSRNRLLLEQEE